MGLTIHFEGKLKSEQDYFLLLDDAKKFACDNHFEYFEIAEENKLLQRVRNDQDWDYQGVTRGIQIQPTDNAEPLILEFDKDLYIQEYCKTQFADAEVHIKVIEFLEAIKPYFFVLEILDEGDYLETKNREILAKHINNCWEAIEKLKIDYPESVGPFRIPSGRIIDFENIET